MIDQSTPTKTLISLDNFEIVVADEYNFALYQIRDKRDFKSKKITDGKTKVLLGYYGNLSSALNKIVNLALLSQDEQIPIQELKNAIERLETHLKERFGSIKPRHFNKKEILTQGVNYEQQLKPHH